MRPDLALCGRNSGAWSRAEGHLTGPQAAMGMGLATKRGSGLLVGALQGAMVSVMGLGLASVLLPLPDRDVPRPSLSVPVLGAIAPVADPVIEPVIVPVAEPAIEPVAASVIEPVDAPEPASAALSNVVQGAADLLPQPKPMPMPEPVISKAMPPDAAPQPVALPAATARPLNVAIGRLPQVSAPPLERQYPATPKMPAVADVARLIADGTLVDPPMPDLSEPDMGLIADPTPDTSYKTSRSGDMLPSALPPVAPLAERRVVLAPGSKLDRPSNPALTADQVRARLLQKATAFTNPQNKPIFAILLMDDGVIGLDQLAQFNVPLSVAINPDWPDAPARAERWRAAGFDVLLQSPKLGDAFDFAAIDSLLQGHLLRVPQALGVVDVPQGGFQGNRRLSGQIAQGLGRAGAALVTFDGRINAAHEIALGASLPAAVVFRDIDAAHEDAEMITRYLERAAFKAAQMGQIVVAGRVSPQTLAALGQWLAGDWAGQLALAPISAVLLRR